MGKITFQFNSYLNYKRKGINVHHLHSPFAFDLVRKVVNDRRRYPDYQRIDLLRKQLRKDLTEVEVTDLGAGIGGQDNAPSHKSVAALYKNNSIRPKYGELLYRLVKYLQPGSILELGTSLGISTAYMAIANPGASVITVEGCEGIAQKAKENFARLGIYNVRQEIGNFDRLLETIIDRVPKLDMAFIDGNHRKDPTIRYFESCLLKSHNDTVLIFDDIHWSKEMNEAWNAICSHKSVTLTLDLFQFGLVFFKKELSKQDFIISY
ncbi:MAG: class I SAM-dependent methyltransferase [Bacteroidota bacterium]|nr:class I SAM-dependent methyltransferase [Bacteroidota bacterium]